MVRGIEQSPCPEARCAWPVESLHEPRPSDPLRRRLKRRRVGERVERADEAEENVESWVVRAVAHGDSGVPFEFRLHDRARSGTLGRPRNRGVWPGGRGMFAHARWRRAPTRQVTTPDEADDKNRAARSGERDVNSR